MFEETSRYFRIKNISYIDDDGREIIYKGRRFLPQGESLTQLLEVTVKEGDRLDLIAARTLGVPEYFWRICDANNALNPFDLTEQPGIILRIPDPKL